MKVNRLVDYVKEYKNKGYSLDRIKNSLIQQGYPLQEIDEAINVSNKNTIINIPKKNIIAIASLIILFILTFFIYLSSLPPNAPYIKEMPILEEENLDSNCTTLNEMECARNPLCRGGYGPSACTGNICTDDMRFRGCFDIPNETVSKFIELKKLCEKTKGTWKISLFNKLMQNCECSGKQLSKDERELGDFEYFSTKYGCKSTKDACINTLRGEWSVDANLGTVCIINGKSYPTTGWMEKTMLILLDDYVG